MKRFVFLAALSLSLTTRLVGQEAIALQEEELRPLLDSLRAAKNDEAKMRWNNAFKKQLATALNEPTAFTYPFDALQTIGKIDSPDNLVRIITWNVEMDDESQRYYAFVLRRDERSNTHKVIELVDNSFMLPPRTDDVLESDNWYGALYYKIIPVEKNNKTYYTLLGWDGNLPSSNIKLIDVLYFSGNSAKLGAPLFKTGDLTTRRVYMEHSEKATMSLNWDPDRKLIIFDHLSPETPTMEGFREYYVPDMSYDAYQFNGNKWTLIEDVIGLNKGRETVKVSTINPRTEEIEEREVENKWIDPTTEGSPASKEVHIAVTPDTEEELAEKAKSENKKNRKGDPQNAMDVYDSKKHGKREKNNSVSYSNSGGKKKKKR